MESTTSSRYQRLREKMIYNATSEESEYEINAK